MIKIILVTAQKKNSHGVISKQEKKVSGIKRYYTLQMFLRSGSKNRFLGYYSMVIECFDNVNQRVINSFRSSAELGKHNKFFTFFESKANKESANLGEQNLGHSVLSSVMADPTKVYYFSTSLRKPYHRAILK